MPALRSSAFAFALALLAGSPAVAEGIAGPYLAGRIASIAADYRTAAVYFNRALIADPSNAALQENALIAYLGIGDFEKAGLVAQALDGRTGPSGLADLAVLGNLARAGDFAAVLAELDKGRTTGPLVDGFLRAWSELGNGQMSQASASFDTMISQKELASLAIYHKALALAQVGDFEGADELLSGRAHGPINASRRSIFAHAQILSQLERNKDAIELIDKTFGPHPSDRMAHALRRELEAGETVPFDLVRTPMDGIAEVFFAVGSALGNEAQPSNPAVLVDTLLFARTAAYLRPDLSDAVLLVAATLETQGQFGLAIEAYGTIPPESPDFLVAELGRAEALVADGRMDAAIEVLELLTRSAPEEMVVWASQGDLLRRDERYAEAVAAYDRAIAMVSAPERANWGLFYARAIGHERLKSWDLAEADFRKALALSPDQPEVLNYLGYSFLEMQTSLDEALGMIETAARARPDNGAISDSLGWAYYRMGRYPDAEAEMERAIGLMPADPVVNDHLGDVYWAVGRKREAEFQWKRALSYGPETEEEANRIRRKLEVGLDAVLKEEGAEPLSVSTNGG